MVSVVYKNMEVFKLCPNKDREHKISIYKPGINRTAVRISTSTGFKDIDKSLNDLMGDLEKDREKFNMDSFFNNMITDIKELRRGDMVRHLKSGKCYEFISIIQNRTTDINMVLYKDDSSMYVRDIDDFISKFVYRD